MLGRAWGRRGEVAAVSLTSGAERFDSVREVFLFREDGPAEGRWMELESVWDHRGGLVFKFRGVDSITDAEGFAGTEVRLPAEHRAPAPEGEYYQSDLVGCEVFERTTGERLGVVARWQDFGGPPLLEIEGSGEAFLVPFARSICVEIDAAARRIVVDLPEGLKELGRK